MNAFGSKTKVRKDGLIGEVILSTSIKKGNTTYVMLPFEFISF